MAAKEIGTKDNLSQLITPLGSSEYIIYRDGDLLVYKVGSTTLHYQWRCIDDLHAMQKKRRLDKPWLSR